MSDVSQYETPAFLKPAVAQAASLVASLTWPGRRTENWKYSTVRQNRLDGFLQDGALSSQTRGSGVAQALTSMLIPSLDTLRLVMVNGFFRADLSADDLPEGLTVCAFADADSDQQALISQKIHAQLESVSDRFQARRLSAMQDGLLVLVAANTKIQKPVEVVWLNTQGQNSGATAQVCLMVLAAGAEASLIECFHCDDALTDRILLGQTYLYLDRKAQLQHYALHQESERAWVVSEQTVDLEAAANYQGFQLALGAELQRIGITVNHLGQQAHCGLNGVYLPKGKSHVDFHTTIEHAVPQCTTDEIFRGIVGDDASAVFNGRIHIHKDAQKTLAKLSNKNLLTSEKAEVNTKPELEIYADDVQCAHGATVAQLDKSSVHYLRTRGIPETQAVMMLSFGFVNELLDVLPHQAIAKYLKPKLASRFSAVEHHV